MSTRELLLVGVLVVVVYYFMSRPMPTIKTSAVQPSANQAPGQQTSPIPMITEFAKLADDIFKGVQSTTANMVDRNASA